MCFFLTATIPMQSSLLIYFGRKAVLKGFPNRSIIIKIFKKQRGVAPRRRKCNMLIMFAKRLRLTVTLNCNIFLR